MNILVVDDDSVGRQKMQKILEKVGTCVSAENGFEALGLFQEAQSREEPFDLVTLDVEMPEMDGSEVLFNLREVEERFQVPAQRRVKVLMVTSHSDKNTVVTCIQAGCDDYIVKPFNPTSVMIKLWHLLGNLKILVADDELVSRRKMQRILGGLGECVTVTDGAAALAVFVQALKQKQPFNLVTLDISMPKIDGREVLLQMRNIEEHHQVPEDRRATIVMVSSQSEKDIVAACIEADCNGYMIKPFERESVYAKLLELLPPIASRMMNDE